MRPRTPIEKNYLRQTARRQGKTHDAAVRAADDFIAIRQNQIKLENPVFTVDNDALFGQSTMAKHQGDVDDMTKAMRALVDTAQAWTPTGFSGLKITRPTPEGIVAAGFDLSTFEGYTAWCAANPGDNTVGDIPLNPVTAPKLAALTDGMRKAYRPGYAEYSATDEIGKTFIPVTVEAWRDNATAEHLVFTMPRVAPSSRGVVIAGAVRSAISRVLGQCPGCTGVDVILDERSYEELSLVLDKGYLDQGLNSDGKGARYCGARIFQYEIGEEMLEARPTWPKRK